MKTKTVEQILSRARQWADAETSSGTTDYHTDAEMLLYLNESWEELVDEILEADGLDLLLTSSDLTSPYSLTSAGVYRDVGLARVESDGREYDLPRWSFHERTRYTSTEYPAWRRIAGAFKFYPSAPTTLTLRLWYIPDATTFVALDTVPVFGGWSTYLSLRIAQKMLTKEERINEQLNDEFKVARKRVVRACQEIHAGKPEQVPDTLRLEESIFDDERIEYLPR